MSDRVPSLEGEKWEPRADLFLDALRAADVIAVRLLDKKLNEKAAKPVEKLGLNPGYEVSGGNAKKLAKVGKLIAEAREFRYRMFSYVQCLHPELLEKLTAGNTLLYTVVIQAESGKLVEEVKRLAVQIYEALFKGLVLLRAKDFETPYVTGEEAVKIVERALSTTLALRATSRVAGKAKEKSMESIVAEFMAKLSKTISELFKKHGDEILAQLEQFLREKKPGTPEHKALSETTQKAR